MKRKTDDPQDYNHIQEWLIPKLEALGLTIEQLANMIGVTRASVYFYCSDQMRPSEEVMIKMCQVLGAPVEEGLRQYTPRRRGRPPARG